LVAFFLNMSELITVRIQVGVTKAISIIKSVALYTTVEEMRLIIRQDQNIEPHFGVVLIFNGSNLKNPEAMLYDFGICDDSMIICIISKETGREIEQLLGNEEEEEGKQKEETHKKVLECEFFARPLGFAVWADEKGQNAIVTKVSTYNASKHGMRIGYCVYEVNDELVFNNNHSIILSYLRTIDCPLRVTFLDLGKEYTISFPSKSLGFTVVKDKEENNARVSKTRKKAARLGVKVGSHIVAVNDVSVFGMEHKRIVNIINAALFPIKLTFREPPRLQPLSDIRMKKSKKKKSLWSNR